jgi:flagellar hook-length control protein FliK
VNSIDALNMSFQPPVVLTPKPFNQKTDSNSAKEAVNFAQLFESITADGQIASEEVVTETSQEELLEKLEDVLQILQDLPKVSMSPEQQEMMYAIIQMLSNQTIQIEEQLQVHESRLEKGTVSNSAQEKLVNLIQQVELELKELMSNSSITKFEDVSEIVGVEEKNILADPKKIDQVFKQLVGFIQQLEAEQQTAGKQTSFQQLEQLDQALKQMNSSTQELASHTQLVETRQSNVINVDTSLQVTGSTVNQQTSDGGLSVETIQTEESSQTLTGGTALDTTKSSQAGGRTETNVPAPTVRMTNLIEELGGVLRSSFRLNGNGEGSQIKVNIFPEHLGQLDIRITEVNGKIAAQIFTSSLVAKEALDLQVNQLRNSLLQQGITIEKIEISQQHSSQSFGQQNAHPDQRFSQQQKQGTASRNKHGYQQLEEEVAVIRNHAVNGMMKVDYTI